MKKSTIYKLVMCEYGEDTELGAFLDENEAHTAMRTCVRTMWLIGDEDKSFSVVPLPIMDNAGKLMIVPVKQLNRVLEYVDATNGAEVSPTDLITKRACNELSDLLISQNND